MRPVAALLAVAALVLGGLVMPAPSRGATFIDTAGHQFAGDIEWAYAEGITGGCGGGRYCPDAPVTREQMASFITRMFTLPATGSDFFTDDESSMHEGDINRVAAAGIAGGCTATTYCPKRQVTRAEMTSFLSRALGLTSGAGNNYFYDDNGNMHEPNIDRAASAGIASGCGEWKFCPSQGVTRGQMAAFLRRVIDPVPAPPFPAPPPPTPAPPPPNNCHPSYTGYCLRMGIGDWDCAGGSGNGPNYVPVRVRVVGYDEYGLDADNDGYGCDLLG
jgi:hypothetical protein